MASHWGTASWVSPASSLRLDNAPGCRKPVSVISFNVQAIIPVSQATPAHPGVPGGCLHCAGVLSAYVARAGLQEAAARPARCL